MTGVSQDRFLAAMWLESCHHLSLSGLFEHAGKNHRGIPYDEKRVSSSVHEALAGMNLDVTPGAARTSKAVPFALLQLLKPAGRCEYTEKRKGGC